MNYEPGNITGDFGQRADGAATGSDPTVREAMAIFLQQTGYKESDTPGFQLHEIMHILAGATNGTLADEGRAAVTEMVMLNCQFSLVAIRADGTFVNPRYPEPTEEAIREWATGIQAIARGGGHYYPELASKIAKAKDLTEDGFRKALQRARAVKNHFAATNDGKSLIDFTMEEIFNMPISKFGLQARELSGKTRFVPFIPIEEYKPPGQEAHL